MKFAALLGSNLTGRVGGLVASHNTYGAYFRRLVRPVNRNTTGQQAQRAAFAAVSQLWRSQSKGSQNAWILAAPQHQVPNSIGGSLTLTGQALFMRINTLRQRIGLALLSNAPSNTDVPAISLFGVTVSIGGGVVITLSGADEWNLSGGGILVSVSPLMAAGVNYIGQFTDLASDVGPVSGDEINTVMPFDLAAGGLLRFRARATTPDGRLSDFVYTDVQVPQAAVVQSFVINSPTSATVTFNRNINSGDFAFGDFTVATGVVTAIAQGDPNTIEVTGTTLATGNTWDLAPSGASAAYTPVQTGNTV